MVKAQQPKRYRTPTMAQYEEAVMAHRFLFVLISVLVIAVAFTGSRFLGHPAVWDVPAHRRSSGAVGTLNVKAAMQLHPKYSELQTVKKKLLVYEQNWSDYIQLLARQAAVDGIKSPFLERLIGFDEAATVQQMVQEARQDRIEYQEKLSRQLDEEIEKLREDLGKEFAQQAEKLEKEAKREILNRQIELAMLSLTQAEAEALAHEIAQIQAKLESDLAKLEDEADGRLEAEIRRVQEAAAEKLAAYDRVLTARLERGLKALQEEAEERAVSEDSREEKDSTGLAGMAWAHGLGDKYQLNTKGVDALEAHYLQELARAEEEIEPVWARYNELYEEILKDLQTAAAQVGRASGLSVILDEDRAEIQGVDITNQVLDILRGEA